MRPRNVVLLLAATLFVASAMPAFGLPSLSSIYKRLTSVEKRQNALSKYVLRAKLSKDVQTMSMTDQGQGFYDGQVSCLPGYTLSGGGVNWSLHIVRQSYRVIESGPEGPTAPANGNSWFAVVSTGGGTAPTAPPTVYAICLKQ